MEVRLKVRPTSHHEHTGRLSRSLKGARSEAAPSRAGSPLASATLVGHSRGQRGTKGQIRTMLSLPCSRQEILLGVAVASVVSGREFLRRHGAVA
ncbi:hypothetical protein C8039_06975 [Halogeometricum sp. wsp3]|nr:hypothetical protein C8039_06975 [Halogeometricum sp. wsp3]